MAIIAKGAGWMTGNAGIRLMIGMCGLFVSLAGCAAPQENLVVPPVSAQIGKMAVKQVYSLERPTVMDAMGAGDAQPEIHLNYDKNKDGPPPAEALQRVPFPTWGEETVSEPDPSNPSGPDIQVTEGAPSWWGSLTLDAGTQLLVSSIEVYSNSHVYRGRILNGPAHNCYVLLVVPVGDRVMPTYAALVGEDSGYLVPSGPPSSTAGSH
jgi:hypothetical protein